MIDRQRMESPQEAPIKVQVVYYLSRAGQLQQPHLIDVTISSNSHGLYLRDVKQRLTAIRGKGVTDSFSWSCKRNYKDNFIWQDLTDNDKVLPLDDGEFVLKGSGLYAGYRAGNIDILDGQVDPESTSLSPKQESVKGHNHTDHLKKFDFESVKRRTWDPRNENLQDQSDLAAALSLSLKLVRSPHAHLKRISKDKSMDLNQQVMNSLSQAKAGPAEECTLDRYDMSSNETFLSEETSTQNTFRESNMSARDCHRSTSTSSRTDLNCSLPVAKQCRTKERLISADDGEKVDNDVVTGRQEKPDELPPVKTRSFKTSVAQELGENASFMLSPRRILAVLSTPEKKLAKMLHPAAVRSSTTTLSKSASSHTTVEPMSAMKFSNKATCLSQLHFCSQLSPHATDSRPDSPVRPANNVSILVQPSTTTQSPGNTARAHSGAYWTRWKPGRKSRSSESKVDVTEEPSTPIQADSRLPADRTTALRRALNSSFEFDMMPVDANSSGPGTPQLPAEPTNYTSNECGSPHSPPRKSITHSSDTPGSVSSPLGPKVSIVNYANAEVMAHISVKQVITERLPFLQSTPAVTGQNFTDGTSVKEIVLPPSPKLSKADDGGQSFSIDTLPRVSLSDSVPGVRVPVSPAQPESQESPLWQHPPSSPIRTNSPACSTNSPVRPLTSPGSFNMRTEDGRPRGRGLLKEVASRDFKHMKDLTKEMERSKLPSCTMRSAVSSRRVSGIKNGITTIGAKSISSTVNRSPPRISSLLWKELPPTPKKIGNIINRDERPLTAGRKSLDWEKTLQEVVSVSLRAPDFGQIVQECGQRGRTFKPDSMKMHVRVCHAALRSHDAETQTIHGSNLTSIRAPQ